MYTNYRKMYTINGKTSYREMYTNYRKVYTINPFFYRRTSPELPQDVHQFHRRMYTNFLVTH